MTTETIHRLLHASPFTPFTVFLADGKAYPVEHPDFATLSKGGRILVINTEGEQFAWVDLLLVTRVESSAEPQRA